MVLARFTLAALLLAFVQGLDVAPAAVESKSTHKHHHKHRHHKHPKKGATALISQALGETPNGTVPAVPAAPQVQATSVPPQELENIASSPTSAASHSLAIFDSDVQQALPAVVDDVRKAAEHKIPLEQLKKTRESEMQLLKEQEALLGTDETGLDKSALQQQVDSTKTMLQSLDGQIEAKRQDAVDILGKALADARAALAQATSQEAAQQAAAQEALKQIKVAQQQKVNANKVIEQAAKVMEVFGGNSTAPTQSEAASPFVSSSPRAAKTEPQELS
mmetsp:Transcript_700/g.1249  ORF Transcript_700/g.1249 Transcript_700/m.1249 type:complete len:277 (-) Transcript_700:30-860(-)